MKGHRRKCPKERNACRKSMWSGVGRRLPVGDAWPIGSREMKSGRPPYSAYLIRVVRRCRAWVRLVESVRPDLVRLAGKLAGSNRETVFL